MPELFRDCTFYFIPVGREMTRVRRSVLAGVAARNGGVVQEVLGPEVSHAVAGAGVALQRLSEHLRGAPGGVRLVTAAWLTEAVRRQQRLPEESFAPPGAEHSKEGPLPAASSASASASAAARAVKRPPGEEPPRLRREPSRLLSPVRAPAPAPASAAAAPASSPASGSRPARAAKAGAGAGGAGGGGGGGGERMNEHVAAGLQELANLYSARGDRWRSWQLVKAARLLRSWHEPLRCPEDFERVAGLGPKTREKCCELLATGQLSRLGTLQGDQATRALQDFTDVHGVGAAEARKWYSAGCRSLDDVRARQDELGLSRVQRLGLKYVEDFRHKIPRGEAMEIVAAVADVADATFGRGVFSVTPCGSLRRGSAQEVSDVDVVLAPRQEKGSIADGMDRLLDELHKRGMVTDDLGNTSRRTREAMEQEVGSQVYLGVFRLQKKGALHRRVDLVLCAKEHLPVVLIHWTGAGLFIRELHRFAGYQGFHLGSHALWDRRGKQAVQVCCATEEDVFAALGLPYREPFERELDAELMRIVQAARAAAKGSAAHQAPLPPKLELKPELTLDRDAQYLPFNSGSSASLLLEVSDSDSAEGEKQKKKGA